MHILQCLQDKLWYIRKMTIGLEMGRGYQDKIHNILKNNQ